MGLGSFIKGGVGEMMIARPDQFKHLIVYKHPDETVPMWSQLTVDSDEGCVFFRDGQLFGILGAGRHTLNSQNIPFLSNFIDSFTGGNVFKAEVFFVRTQPLRNDPVKFGGSLDGMTDPGTELWCTPRIFGELVVRVMDPIKFIIGLTGQAIQPHDNQAILRYVGTRFLMGVEQAIADVCMAEGTSILQISGKKMELARRFIQNPPGGFAEVGLSVVEVAQFKITLPPDQQKELSETWNLVGKAKREAMAKQFEINQKIAERAAYVDMAHNPAYMAHAQAEALIKAGEGMAKGGDGGGAGVASLGAQMAVGVGMAGMFQQGMYQPGMQYQRTEPPRPGGSVKCGSCGADNPGGKFCAQCGSPLAPPQPAAKFCNNCGSQATGKFCSNCGTTLPDGPTGGGAPPAQGGPPPGAPPPAGGGYPPPPQAAGYPGAAQAAGYPSAPQAAPQAGIKPGYPAAPAGAPPQQPPQGYPAAPQGYPAAPQGYPAAPQGYPAAPQGPPAAPQGYPAAPQGYPPAPPGGGSYSGGTPGGGGEGGQQ
jgi:membrane protease subunit (stomatin/prohibitin family)